MSTETLQTPKEDPAEAKCLLEYRETLLAQRAQQLQEMGFGDLEMLTEMLRANDLSLQRVIDQLSD